MEELDFQALLDIFRSNGFQAGERAILGHFGTVQTLLTLVFNAPVTVHLVEQKRHNGDIIRKVDLLARGKTVCSAVSRIPEDSNVTEVLHDIWAGNMGLGQIIALHRIPHTHKLISVGRDETSFYRKYKISGTRLDMDIFEHFPRQPFIAAGWLQRAQDPPFPTPQP